MLTLPGSCKITLKGSERWYLDVPGPRPKIVAHNIANCVARLQLDVINGDTVCAALSQYHAAKYFVEQNHVIHSG
jgi:hypothetical protein